MVESRRLSLPRDNPLKRSAAPPNAASLHPPAHRSSPPHLPLVRAGSPRETRAAERWRVGRTVPRIILAPA